MKTKTQLFLELWIEARTRFTNQLEAITATDVTKKLAPSPNSVGFLIRHMGEVELLFAKNVFGASNVKITAKTVIDKYDTGEWTDLQELKKDVKQSFETDSDWETIITTKEFGTKTKAEAFGRIVSHTAYHAGQLAIINKYGH